MTSNNQIPIVWSAIYAGLLLLTFTPLALISVSLIMIPVIVLFVKLDTVRFIAHYALTLLAVLIISAVFGNALFGGTLIMLSLFFLAPAIVIGYMYKKQYAARIVLTAGVISLLSQLLIILLALTMLGVNITSQMHSFIQEGFSTFPDQMKSQFSDETVALLVENMTQMLPLFLIGLSFYYTVITHWLSRKVLLRMGEKVAGLRKAKYWKLPKSLVWYYLAALAISLFFAQQPGSMMHVILLNIIPLLMLAFSIQAVAFLFFVADLKGWNRALPITAMVLIFIVPPLQNLMSLLGVFDVAFPIRDRLKGNHNV